MHHSTVRGEPAVGDHENKFTGTNEGHLIQARDIDWVDFESDVKSMCRQLAEIGALITRRRTPMDSKQ